MKKLLKIVLYLIAGILLILLAFLLFLWINSPGKSERITDSNGKHIPGSIAMIEELQLGGQKQSIIIRGTDITKPVMLFLHGGPGSPNLLLRAKNPEIENDFVMVYWEQLGAGKSYSPDIPAEQMTVPRFIDYTRKLSEYLIKRFRKEKISILGESWGSLLGILTVQQHPELFHAYFGTGQMVHTYKGEQITLDWVKQQALSRNDESGIRDLVPLVLPDSLADGKTWADYFGIQRNYISKYGGSMIKPADAFEMNAIMTFAKDYRLSEKFKFGEGFLFSIQHLAPSVTKANLFRDIDSLQLPVYFFQGRNDYHTPYILVEAFYKQLKAPKKELIPFEHSAHSPHVEEKEKFNAALRERAVE